MTVAYRLLEELDELDGAVAVVKAVWGSPEVPAANRSLLRAYAHAGNPVLGAVSGGDGRVVGVAIGFLAPEGGLHLHSHIAAVLPSHQGRGLGFGLKQAQRAWCASHGIGVMRWTFDPVLARNAHFNFHKLGTRSSVLLPDLYGAMDDDINAGETSDRLAVSWSVGDACPPAGRACRYVPVPGDYAALRRADPGAAAAARASVRDGLVAAFDDGLEVVDFTPSLGYHLTPREG